MIQGQLKGFEIASNSSDEDDGRDRGQTCLARFR